LIRNRPSDKGQHVDGDAGVPREAEGIAPQTVARSGMTLRQAVRTPVFWIYGVGFMLLFFGMMGWQLHQVPFYESVGMSRAAAALIVSASAALSIVARLTMGVVSARFERFEGMTMLLFACLFLAMATLLVSTSIPAIGVFMLFWVIGTSAGPMVESLVLIKAFGVRHFATILGAILVIETLGQIFSPALAGAIYDRTGSYDAALVMFMAVFAAGLVMFAIASRMALPVHAND
jgi:predicted MFS family arabinose efflux permease